MDPFLIGFIALAVLFVLLFIGGVAFIIIVLPGKSEARRRRDRRNARLRQPIDRLVEFYKKK